MSCVLNELRHCFHGATKFFFLLAMPRRFDLTRTRGRPSDAAAQHTVTLLQRKKRAFVTELFCCTPQRIVPSPLYMGVCEAELQAKRIFLLFMD
jgi:hypothetical protein